MPGAGDPARVATTSVETGPGSGAQLKASSRAMREEKITESLALACSYLRIERFPEIPKDYPAYRSSLQSTR